MAGDAARANGGPSRGLPGRQAGVHRVRREGSRARPHGTAYWPSVSCPSKRWVKIVTPPGCPRSKPQTPRAERRGFGGVASTFPRLASESRGVEARGSCETRRSARPHLSRDRQIKTTTPPRRKEQGCISASTRVFTQNALVSMTVNQNTRIAVEASVTSRKHFPICAF